MLRKSTLIILCVANFIPLVFNQRKLYDGYSLIKITPQDHEHLNFLHSLVADSSAGLDFWLEPSQLNGTVDVVVPPNSDILQQLASRSISFETKVEDFGKLFREEVDEEAQKRKGFFERYNTLTTIYNFLYGTMLQHSDIAKFIEVGRSYEGRPMYAIKLSTSINSQKPIIWIEGGIHAAEHIGPAVVTYILNQFVTEYNQFPDTKLMLDTFDWYILPVVNPDGYEYTFQVDRLWRKTRSFNPNKPECYGADPNRNWDFHWNETESGQYSKRDPCTPFFVGVAAFSEPESRAVSKFLLPLKGRLLMFIDFHSYSQKWMPPWGYTKYELPENFEEQAQLARIGTAALTAVHGTQFQVGSSARIFNVVSGGSRDWAYAVAGARYSYTIELRDTGEYGFLLPDTQVKPSCEETWAGIKAVGFHLALKQLGIEA